MFRGLPTASLPLTQLFANPYLFTVPAYQRPYSWTTKEAGQLLEDVTKAAGIITTEPGEPDYFFGMILLLDPESDSPQPPTPYGSPRVYEVVDGQQRLATLAILATGLRDLEDRDGPVSADTVQLADRLDHLLRLERHERDITHRRTRLRLSDSEQPCFEAHILARPPSGTDNVPAVPEIKEVRDYIYGEIAALTRDERRKLGRYLLDYCHVVIIITPELDRAHLLFSVLNERGKPLERKDILKVETLRGLGPRDAGRGTLLWQQAQSILGPELEPFFSHLRHIYANPRLPIIAGMRAFIAERGSMPFLETIVSPMAKALHRLRTFQDDPAISKRKPLAAALTSLDRLGRSDWVPSAMLSMAHFDKSPDTASELLIEIERLAFLLHLRQIGVERRQRRFAAVVAAIRDNPETALTSGAFEITRDEQRTIAHHLKDIHRRNAALTKLLLMRIEDELSGAPLSIDVKGLSVEHILPLRPSPTSSWRKLFPDSEEREACQSSLGNLAIVTQRQNDRAENKDFPQKLEIYREPQPGIPNLVSNATILEAGTWLARDIRAREARMLATISQLWRIDGLSPGAAGTAKVKR